MENASKALIMAGGMLLAILIVSLLIYAWSLFSEYQASKVELNEIEDTAKFNEQFTNYDRNDVEGYEIISLVNKIVDYNERKTTETKNGNEYKYPFIKISINLNGQNNKLAYEDVNVLFTKNQYEDNEFSAQGRVNAKSSFENEIVKKLNEALDLGHLDERKATKFAKNIGAIFLTKNDITQKANSQYNGSTDPVYESMVVAYNSATDSNETIQFAKNNLVLGENAKNNKYYNYACIYYEYMQFKKAIFECDNLTYDTANNTGRVSSDTANTGRVLSISFKFTGKLH